MSRLLTRLLLAVLAIPAGYIALLLVLGLLPANAGWREADAGVTIFVTTNGVHTGIAVPLVHDSIDWRPLVPADHLREPVAGANYLVIGYGDREFYLNTPSWAELSLDTALTAATDRGATLLQVDHVREPRETGTQRALTLSPEQYRRLAAFIRARFRLDEGGRTLPVLGRGYGGSDMFYEANGGYSAWFTCNEWTGRALRAAGVRTGWWTPLSQSVMWHLP